MVDLAELIAPGAAWWQLGLASDVNKVGVKRRARFCKLYGPVLKSTRTIIMPNGCCCVYGCSNRSAHSLPLDTFLRKQWQIAVRRENFTPTGSSKCARSTSLEVTTTSQTTCKKVCPTFVSDFQSLTHAWTRVYLIQCVHCTVYLS